MILKQNVAFVIRKEHGVFNKALLPILLFFTTVSLGVVLLFVVLRLTSTRSVTPTTPEPSGATNACVTDVIKIKDLNHLVCENNTCMQKDGPGTSSCQTANQSQGCFVCNSLTADKTSGYPSLTIEFTMRLTSQKTPNSFEIDFGDGTTKRIVQVPNAANPVKISHTYTTVGSYKAVATAISTNAANVAIRDTNTTCEKTITVTDRGKYLKCDNEQCKEFTKVTGNETNQCDADDDCEEETPKHSECSNMQCKEVDGEGNDECDADADCYKYSCVNESCSKIEGEGADSCNNDSDCEPADNGNNPTHLACKNQACVRVSGEGENQCSVNSDCATVAETPAKPVVPKTGSSGNTPIYLLIAGAFIAIGGVLFRKRLVR